MDWAFPDLPSHQKSKGDTMSETTLKKYTVTIQIESHVANGGNPEDLVARQTGLRQEQVQTIGEAVTAYNNKEIDIYQFESRLKQNVGLSTDQADLVVNKVFNDNQVAITKQQNAVNIASNYLSQLGTPESTANRATTIQKLVDLGISRNDAEGFLGRYEDRLATNAAGGREIKICKKTPIPSCFVYIFFFNYFLFGMSFLYFNARGLPHVFFFKEF